jgi:hypothetical protein
MTDRPLFGELVVASAYDHEGNNPDMEAMERQAQAMIQEAAYFIAEKRGFAPGHELEDWLKAKAQVLKDYL